LTSSAAEKADRGRVPNYNSCSVLTVTDYFRYYPDYRMQPVAA